MFNYKFTGKVPLDVCKMCGEKISQKWSNGGIGATCQKCSSDRDKLDLVKLGIIRNIEPDDRSFKFEALIDGEWYECGPCCGDWSYVKANKHDFFSVPVGYWEMRDLYVKHELEVDMATSEDSPTIIIFNNRKYKKVGPDEPIRDGALQSFNGGTPCPITNALGETVGFTPSEFSNLRIFYNPYNKEGTCKWCGVTTINSIGECDTCHELKLMVAGNREMVRKMLEELY